MKQKYGFVYIWRDRKHNRYYIGCHWGVEDDGYICSSPWLLHAYSRRPEDFKRRILQRTTNRQETFLAEQNWLQLVKDDELRVRYYNLHKHVADYWHQYEDKRLSIGEKISQSVKAHRNTPEGQANYLAGIEKKRGRKQSPEDIAKRTAGIKQAMAVKYPIEQRQQRSIKGSEEHSQKLSNASNRRWAKPDAKAKQAEISKALHLGKHHRLGQINTPEHREKISAANKGRKLTDEQRQQMSEVRKGKPMPAGFKEQQSIRIKEMWAKRRAGLFPMPNYNAVK
jgi:hypothetical protein